MKTLLWNDLSKEKNIPKCRIIHSSVITSNYIIVFGNFYLIKGGLNNDDGFMNDLNFYSLKNKEWEPLKYEKDDLIPDKRGFI
jgi:hypothetical protein